jgi:formamidopyrimidine-DNA glycosylase
MPELPEVETVARGVHDRVNGERIVNAWFSEKPEPFKTPPAEMADTLADRTIEQVRRVGKHIVFDLSPINKPGNNQPVPEDEVQWIVHLGMTGRLLVSEASIPVPPHTHGILHLSSGRELRFVDARRFGRMGLHRSTGTGPSEPEEGAGPAARQEKAKGPGFAGMGREPLTISQDDFRALFHGRKTSIKGALLNQKLLHGVGNIYADESLFRAGIRPRRMAGRLTRAELDRLRANLVAVLKAAIALGGSSVSDYVDADGVRGFFQLEHRVYMRGGEPCLVCGTPIRRIVVAGRGTHYCSMCQR